MRGLAVIVGADPKMVGDVAVARIDHDDGVAQRARRLLDQILEPMVREVRREELAGCRGELLVLEEGRLDVVVARVEVGALREPDQIDVGMLREVLATVLLDDDAAEHAVVIDLLGEQRRVREVEHIAAQVAGIPACEEGDRRDIAVGVVEGGMRDEVVGQPHEHVFELHKASNEAAPVSCSIVV